MPAPQTEMEFTRRNSKLRGCGQYWPSLGRQELEACRKSLTRASANKMCKSVPQNDASRTWPCFRTGSELIGQPLTSQNPMTYTAWRAKGASQGLTWLAKKCQVRPAPQTEMEFTRRPILALTCKEGTGSLRETAAQAPAHKICRSVRQNDASQTWPFFGTGSEIVGQPLTNHNLIVRATTRFNELTICLHMPRWTAYNLDFLGSNPC